MGRGKTRTLTIQTVGDNDDLIRSNKQSNKSLDSLGKQTRLTSSITSKGFAAMKVGATGAAAGIAGLAIATKKVVEASIESEKSNSRMIGQLKALGISYKEHAAQIDNVIQKTSQLAGLDDEDLQDAFTSMVRTTGDVNKSLKDLALVADLARAKNMEVGRAGEFVAKIHAGNVGGLRRLGLEFTKTTENVDKLKKANKDASSQDVLFAKALDQRANSERALNLLRNTFSGQAERYGRTTAGAVDRANVAFENLEETIGAAVAPTVQKAATATAKFVNEMQDGTGQGGRFVRKLKEIWESVKPVIAGMGRAAQAVGKFVAEHPEVAKLAAAVIAVGGAVRGLKFISAATGFSSLLKVGTSAARLLRRRLVQNAAAGGAESAAAAASGFAGGSATMSKAGTTAGRAAGKGFVKGFALALPLLVWEFKDQINAMGNAFSKTTIGKILTAPQKLGELAGNLTGKLLGTNRKQAGGMIPGSGRGDIVPAMLEPGEFVIRRKVVEKFGPTYFANINGGMGDKQGQGQVPGYTSGGIIARANKMDGMGLPYLWGGGHGGGIGNGVDCSGAVSWALGVSPRVSGQFQSFGKPGAGLPNDTKIYANPNHVFAVFNGRGWGTSRENPGGGPGWLSYNHRSGFTIRHLSDADGTSSGSTTAGNSQESAETGKQRRTARQERSGSRAVNKLVAQFGGGSGGFAATTRAAAVAGGVIEARDTAYGQLERQFGQTDEDLGTPGGRVARLGELGALAGEKRKQLNRQKKRAGLLRQAISKLEGLLKAGRKQRDRAKGAKRAKINERLRTYDDRLTDLKAELASLGFAIRDTELDIGDLAKEAKEVAGTPNTEPEAGPTVSDRVSDLTSLIDLRERSGVISPATAQSQKAAVIQSVLGGSLGALDERTRLQLQGDLIEVQQQGVQAMEDNTAAIKALQQEIADNTAFARQVLATENASLLGSITALISGEIAGKGMAGRALMPGAYGVRARY